MGPKKPGADATQRTSVTGYTQSKNPQQDFSSLDDDEWDFEVEVEASPYTVNNRMPESDAKLCPACQKTFGFFIGKHYCLQCYKVFCSDCAPFNPAHNGDRICTFCLAAERNCSHRQDRVHQMEAQVEEKNQAVLSKIRGQMTKTQQFEAESRLIVMTDRDEQLKKVQIIAVKQQNKIWKEEEEAKKHSASRVNDEKKGGIIDHWKAIHAPRSGSLSLVVARAQRLVPPKLMFSTSAAVLVKGERTEFESDAVSQDVNPEWDFETYFAVEDDTVPIFFYVRDWTLPYPHQIACASLNLRDSFDNLVRTVSDEEVYIEKGHVILDCFKHDKKLPKTNLTVHWTFELREVNETRLCEDCGRIERRCRCSEEEKKERREAADRLRQEQAQREQEEQEARYKAEYGKKVAEAAKRAAAAQKQFDADYADLEANRDKAKRAMWYDERRAWETVDKAHRDGFHRVKIMESERRSRDAKLQLCIGEGEVNLFKARFQCWRSFAFKTVEERRKKHQDNDASAAIVARRKEDHAENSEAATAERKRQATKREEQYQDGAKSPSDHMVDEAGNRRGGRPRGEVHHSDGQKKEPKEDKGCCVVM